MRRLGIGLAILSVGMFQGCGQGSRGGDSGPRLSILEGPSVVGPGGRLTISAIGSGTGPLSWALVPPGLGQFNPEPSPMRQVPTSPSPSFALRGTFTAGPSLGSAEFQVAAGEGAHRFQASTVLSVVQGIAVTPSIPEVQATPHLQVRIAVSVTAPGLSSLRVPQEVAWSAEGDFADGQILSSAPGSLVFNAPARAGTYLLKGVADADPSASTRVRIVVS